MTRNSYMPIAGHFKCETSTFRAVILDRAQSKQIKAFVSGSIATVSQFAVSLPGTSDPSSMLAWGGLSSTGV